MRMPEEVDQEPCGPHTDNYMGFLDFMWVGESLDGLQYYGKTESCEEHCVDQSPHHLSPDPSECVFICRLCFLSEAHGHQSHKQRYDIRYDPTDDNLHDKKAKIEFGWSIYTTISRGRSPSLLCSHVE
uniref:Uncharacterized protein n=1 Tax=Oncorhynchus tshawytscha TaxID=74940 RepID=A0A8C8GJZ5_ONCTS